MSPGHEDAQLTRFKWWVICVTALLTLGFGTWGMWDYDHAHHDPRETPNAGLTLAGALYTGLGMLLLHAPHLDHATNWQFELGRWLGASALIFTTAVLVSKRIRHEYRRVVLRTWRDHFVVCGLGRKGLEIVRCLKKDHPKARVVVIDPDPEHRFIEACEDQGVYRVAGDATDPATLRAAHVERAREIFAVTPSDETNIRVAAEVRARRAQANAPTATCRVHVSNLFLTEALQRWAEDGTDRRTELRFFDVFDHEARRILLELPIDGTGIARDDPRAVQIVIMGLGRLGSAVAARAAKMGHFANGKPLRISVIDREADRQREQLFFRYPALAENNICTIDFHKAEAESLAARALILDWAKDPHTILHLFVCLKPDTIGVEMGLRLREALAGRAQATILIRINSHVSLSPVLEAAAPGGVSVRPFGMVEEGCSEAFRNEYNEAMATTIHEEFAGTRRTADPDRRDDPALRPWDELREEFRESNRQQADHIPIKLRAIGCAVVPATSPGEAIKTFEPDEIAILAQLEHTRWNAERWLSGWTFGPETDKSRRVHSCLVPWAELSPKIQSYDIETVEKIPRWLMQVQPPHKVVRIKTNQPAHA